MSFKSLFTGKNHAQLYKAFRPNYSENIFSFITSTTKKWLPKSELSLAVDVGCGSGQATAYLAKSFDLVVGLDVSASQVQEAKDEKVCGSQGDFILATDTKIPLKTASCSYIQVFQAAHWFDLSKFYSEVDRILIPGGVLVLGVYGTGSMRLHDNQDFIREQGEEKIKSFNAEYLSFYELLKANNYFPAPIRDAVDSLYRDYPLPYEEQLRSFDLRMNEHWTIDHCLGYFRSWSGWQQYCAKTGDSSFLDKFEKKWKADFGDRKMVISWPMGLLFSRKPNK